jgi:hypothetical protein
VDSYGKQYYPNGTRIVNDSGDEIRYPNGARVRTMAGDFLFPNGSPVKTMSGDVRYPNGQVMRDSGGRCFFETSVEMTSCPRSVSVRDALGGGATAAYELDTAAGTIDLRRVRFRFSSGRVVTVLSADLVAGQIDGQSIAAVCR